MITFDLFDDHHCITLLLTVSLGTLDCSSSSGNYQALANIIYDSFSPFDFCNVSTAFLSPTGSGIGDFATLGSKKYDL